MCVQPTYASVEQHFRVSSHVICDRVVIIVIIVIWVIPITRLVLVLGGLFAILII